VECCGEDSGCEEADSTVTSEIIIFVCRRCNVKGGTYYGAAIVTDLEPRRTGLLDGSRFVFKINGFSEK
jgi:hypothetical protein